MDRKSQDSIISIHELLNKSHKFVASQEALKDITPPNWSGDVLEGKKKIVVGTKDEVR